MSKATHVVIDGVSYPLDDTTAVDFSEAQSLSAAEKQQARTNIGAGSAADVTSIQTAIGTVPSGSNLQGEVDDLKNALNDLADGVAVIGTETEKHVLTWDYGMVNANGSVLESNSYIHSNKCTVKEGSSISLHVTSNNLPIRYGLRVCAYNGNTVIPASGKSDDFAFPYIVPSGIDGIVISISAAYLAETPYANETFQKYEPKNEDALNNLVQEVETNSIVPKNYPFKIQNDQRTNIAGIIGLWIKNADTNAKYYLTEVRYNQTVGSAVYTKIAISKVLSGNTSEIELTIKNDGVYIPEKGIEYFENDYILICIDWSKMVNEFGYSVPVSEAYELDAKTLTKANVLPIAVESTGGETVIEKITVATQIQQITSVQKQIIESQIDVVDSARNAANNGVLPSNSGSTNFTNLQAMLDVGGTIVVDVPGIYEIDGMLKIGSDTELIFGKQVYMKKMNSVGGFIVNVGASTNTYNENIAIKGLNLICNGKNSDSIIYRRGLRGQIAFGFVKNLVLDEIYCDDIPSDTYFIHIAAYDNVLIQNCHIEGNKDGIHSSCGENLTIRNCYFNTADDPIALNCQDYVSSIPYYGWIKNVLIENCIDDSPTGSGGVTRARSVLVYGGAWADWESGNTYRNGDTIVASNNYVYRLVSQTAISDQTVITSTVEPTHSSGQVTESDGCTWLFIQNTPVYNVAVENLTIRNYYVKCPRVEVIRFHNDNSQYVRSIYPTAIMPPHKNITLDNIVIDKQFHADYFVGFGEPVDLIRVLNSHIAATWILRVQGEYLVSTENAVENIIFIGNELYRESGSIVLVICVQDGKTANVKTYGNYSNTTVYNSVTAGTVNMITNDLFT